MTPSELLNLSGFGATTVEEVLLAAVAEWASAYLHEAEDDADDTSLHRTRRELVQELIGRVPDPESDRQLLLALRDPDDPSTQRLARRLHTDVDLRCRPLRELLPGLGLVESQAFSSRLSVRAFNGLGQAGACTLRALAGMTPSALLALSDVGVKVAEETLAVAIAEWASAYLDMMGSPERVARPDNGIPSPDVDPESLRRNLTTICAWAAQVHRTTGAVEAVQAAATAKDHLPRQVEHALRELTRFGTAVDSRTAGLSDAFAEVEEKAAFETFRRRQLVPGKNPTQLEIAAELGISAIRVSKHESAVRAMLSKRMQDKDSPISIAVEEMRDRLGAVAQPKELRKVLGTIDRDGEALTKAMPHRKALLLKLAGYRLSAEWVLDTEIENLTKLVLDALTERGPVDLDSVDRQLTRLGVRKDLQLPWITSQLGFRIADGKLVQSWSGSSESERAPRSTAS
jgi:hypothetical protein